MLLSFGLPFCIALVSSLSMIRGRSGSRPMTAQLLKLVAALGRELGGIVRSTGSIVDWPACSTKSRAVDFQFVHNQSLQTHIIGQALCG